MFGSLRALSSSDGRAGERLAGHDAIGGRPKRPQIGRMGELVTIERPKRAERERVAQNKRLVVDAVLGHAYPRDVPVIFSNGMGAESGYLTLRLLDDPTYRDFDLGRLVIVSAQTGFEDPATARFVEDVLMPRARAHRVRWIQVGRRSPHEGGGYVILDDSREPRVCFVAGAYTIQQEMREAGTVPTLAGERKCSLHSKAAPVEAVISEYLGLEGKPYRHIFGYSRGEEGRVAKSEAAVAARNLERARREAPRRERGKKAECTLKDAWWLDGASRAVAEGRGEMGEYPIVREGKTRDECVAWIAANYGASAPKSRCVFCCFQKPERDPSVVARWLETPAELVAEALAIELASLRLNPRIMLFGDSTMREHVERAGYCEALDLLEETLASVEHAVYRVRRVITAPGKGPRRLERMAVGARDEIEALFAREFAPGRTTRELHGAVYAFVHERERDVFPTFEEYFVIAPAYAGDKVAGRPETFEQTWLKYDPAAVPTAGVTTQRALLFGDPAVA